MGGSRAGDHRGPRHVIADRLRADPVADDPDVEARCWHPQHDRLSDLVAQALQNRLRCPEDVASVVLLASDPAAEYMTGQVIPVDGGLSAGRYGIPVADE